MSERRELTDDDFSQLWIKRPSIHGGELDPQLYDFARAVIAADHAAQDKAAS